MVPQTTCNAIRRELSSIPRTNVFAVLDGASVPDLLPQLARLRPPHVCLYRGDLEPDLAKVAPYLVQLTYGSPTMQWVIQEGWGNHWGIFAVAGADLRLMRRQFRSFIMVRDPNGKQLYFRFYDPRVFRQYLPTCNEEELRFVFGPVNLYVMEAEDPGTLLRFTPDSPLPRTTRI